SFVRSRQNSRLPWHSPGATRPGGSRIAQPDPNLRTQLARAISEMIPETVKDGLYRAPTDRLPSDRLIVALDFPDTRAALALVDRLHGATHWLKVGLELYIAGGNSLVAELKRRGFSIFLDLKLHDIPNTVASAVRAATQLGVDMLTVHAAGGPEMLT